MNSSDWEHKGDFVARPLQYGSVANLSDSATQYCSVARQSTPGVSGLTRPSHYDRVVTDNQSCKMTDENIHTQISTHTDAPSCT